MESPSGVLGEVDAFQVLQDLPLLAVRNMSLKLMQGFGMPGALEVWLPVNGLECFYASTISRNSLPKFPSIHFSQRWTSSGTSENHSVSFFKIIDLNGWVCQQMGEIDLRLESTKVHGVIFKMHWSTMVIQPFGYHQQSGYITPWVTRTTLLGYDWNCPNFTAWKTAPRWWVNYIIIRDYIIYTYRW